MNYSITLEEFINRIDYRIIDEIYYGMSFGHVNYSAYIDSESLLEATTSCSDGKEAICNNIKKMIFNKLKENKHIESFKIEKVELIVKPQEDLTNNTLEVVERDQLNKHRKYIQVKIGFKKKVNKEETRYLSLKSFPENIFENIDSDKKETIIYNYLIEHGRKFSSVNDLIVFVFNNFKEKLHLETKKEIKVLKVSAEKSNESEKIYGVFTGYKNGVFTDCQNGLNQLIGYVIFIE